MTAFEIAQLAIFAGMDAADVELLVDSMKTTETEITEQIETFSDKMDDLIKFMEEVNA